MMTKQNVVSWCDWGTEKDIRLREGGGESQIQCGIQLIIIC